MLFVEILKLHPALVCLLVGLPQILQILVKCSIIVIRALDFNVLPIFIVLVDWSGQSSANLLDSRHNLLPKLVIVGLEGFRRA